jgi:tetratricopeptide (TPR) repeat protein
MFKRFESIGSGARARKALIARVDNGAARMTAQGFAGAETELRACLQEALDLCGLRDELVLRIQFLLAKGLVAEERYAEAEDDTTQWLATGGRTVSVEYAASLWSLHALALTSRGRHEQALDEFTRLSEAADRLWGPRHVYTLKAASDRSQNLCYLQRHDQAEKLARTVLAGSSSIVGPHGRYLRSAALNSLAVALCGQRRYTEGETAAREGLDLTAGPNRSALARFEFVLGLAMARALNGQHRYSEALACATTAHNSYSPTATFKASDASATGIPTATALLGLGRPSEAHATATEAALLSARTLSPIHARTREAEALAARCQAVLRSDDPT